MMLYSPMHKQYIHTTMSQLSNQRQLGMVIGPLCMSLLVAYLPEVSSLLFFLLTGGGPSCSFRK